MKILNILEAKYTGGTRPALEFLKGAIDDESSFLDDDEDGDYDEELIGVYQWAMQSVKAGEVKTSDDLEKISDAVYRATGSGDTDLTDHVYSELGRLLGIL